jgi:uncharacterized protein (DUF1697 family)
MNGQSPLAMATTVALLRGINVGRAKRVSMADLRDVFIALGYGDVQTVLQSGNVVFTAERAPGPREVAAIERALHDATGVQASVLLVPRRDLAQIAAANPLRDVSTDPSRSFVTFLSRPLDPASVPAVDAEALAPEVLVVHERAIYQWCPEGALATKVPRSWWKQLDQVVTTRNWRTVQRLVELSVPA